MMDLRYALRLLLKSPLFTTAIVLTSALGIGATTTIFSVVNAVLVRPLPFADPERLMQVAEKNDKLHLPAFGASALNYLSWKEQTRAFDDLGAIQFSTFTLLGHGDPETYTGNAITPSLMPLLGLRPLVGRAFADGDDKPGAAPIAMISESLWRRRFGGDKSIVGKPATLNGVAYTIVGIAPPALPILTNGDVWVPLVIDPPKEMRLNHVLLVVGRLKPDVTREAAQAEMDTIAARVGQEHPEVRDWGINLITFADAFVSTQLRLALLVLLGAVGFVLLIVSANIANLLLARATARRPEMVVRVALGAGMGRLMRQLLIESLVLSIAGGILGIATAFWAVGFLESSLPPNVLPIPDIGVDPTVLVFAAGVTCVTGLLFGFAPAWQAASTDVSTALRHTGRWSSGSSRARFRRVLASGELALATVLLVGATLLIRSLIQLQHVPLGFDPEGVISLQVSLPPTKYPMAKRVTFFRDLREALQTIPGVIRVGISSGIPFGAGNYTTSPVTAPGQSLLPPGASVPIDWRTVSPGYFDAMKIPLLGGRDFTDSDTVNAPEVMILSRATARAFWGDDDPIGKTVRRVADAKDFTVVGLVGDVRSTSLNNESPALYYSSGTRIWPLMDIVVRPAGDPAPVIAAIRGHVHAMDPDVPITNLRPMTEWVSGNAAQPRFNATLLGVFAAVALFLAAIGIYGVLAYSVSLRTKEIGLRMALGAERGAVSRLVVREGMGAGLTGIAIGIAASIAASRVISALVFGVTVRDASTYVGVSILLAVVAFASCVAPALRASRVDPMIALRLE
jgi:putative ABC transport system permease protein